ncbi:MAG: thioesterase [Streptosporangiales bacterium]|nr:thioesterase [Streptosporangiales bacterium]
MRPIPDGYECRLDITVTAAMTVDFGHLGAAHQVYATYWMARHFEEVGRMVLVPHLETGEQGAGTKVHVEHDAAAPLGSSLVVTGRHRATSGNRLLVDCAATLPDGTVVGHGWTEQAVLPEHVLASRLDGPEAPGQPSTR